MSTPGYTVSGGLTAMTTLDVNVINAERVSVSKEAARLNGTNVATTETGRIDYEKMARHTTRHIISGGWTFRDVVSFTNDQLVPTPLIIEGLSNHAGLTVAAAPASRPAVVLQTRGHVIASLSSHDYTAGSTVIPISRLVSMSLTLGVITNKDTRVTSAGSFGTNEAIADALIVRVYRTTVDPAGVIGDGGLWTIQSDDVTLVGELSGLESHAAPIDSIALGSGINFPPGVTWNADIRHHQMIALMHRGHFFMPPVFRPGEWYLIFVTATDAMLLQGTPFPVPDGETVNLTSLFPVQSAQWDILVDSQFVK
mgnify:CR=1 FL=1